MKQSRTITLPPDIWGYIDQSRGDMTRGAYIEYCIKNADKYEDPKSIIRRHVKIIGLHDAELKGWLDSCSKDDFKDAHRILNNILTSVDIIVEVAINNIK